MRAVVRAYQALCLAGTLMRLLRWLAGENRLSGHAGGVAAVALMVGMAANAMAQEKPERRWCTAMGCEPVFYSVPSRYATLPRLASESFRRRRACTLLGRRAEHFTASDEAH